MTNKEKYQQAFSVLKASRPIEVEDLKMNKNMVLKRIVATAAVVALCFGASNGICYAATGATWVEKMVVIFNGQKIEKPVQVTSLGNGDFSYTMPVSGETGSMQMTIVTDEGGLDATPVIVSSDEGVVVPDDTPMISVEDDGKIYIKYGEAKVDITEDFEDGEASGTLKFNDLEYKFLVEGNVEVNSITLRLCE